MGRVGILGGTFNPPHLAHLVCAQEARDQLRLDRVLLVPVSIPPHKEAGDDPGPVERARMCALASAEDEWLELCTLEIDRGGRSYTVDTLRELRAGAPDDELVLVLGGDAARSLPDWREPDEILHLASVGVAGRAGVEEAAVTAALTTLSEARDRVVFFEMPRLDISSSDIRRRVASGRPVRHLVPDAVAEYIAQRGLYRVPAGRGAA
jgi:nicotinate-nucleotide adenylyltransferase